MSCSPNNGCPVNISIGNCPAATCCKEKTVEQQFLQDNLDKVADLRLQLRLLKDEFMKRPKNKCSTFVPMAKSEYTSKKQSIERRISKCLKANTDAKNARKGKFIIRSSTKNCESKVTTSSSGCSC